MIRAAGTVIAAAAAVGVVAPPLIGLPEGFLWRGLAALVLWLVAAATVAGCVAPARPVAAACAAVAGVCAWPLALWTTLSPFAGAVALAAGVVIAYVPDDRPRGQSIG